MKGNAMKTSMKAPLLLLFGATVALSGLAAFGQSTATDSKTSDTQKKAADFSAKEKAMQAASRNSSGAAMPTSTEAVGLNQNKDAGKESAAAELSLQIPHGSRPVDKNAKAVAPIKNISKMTPEERNELRTAVVKDAKP
jgi:uncharacterized membrane protein